MNTHKLTLPLTSSQIKELHQGDKILLSGVIHTARDQAHLRLIDLLIAGNPLPFDLSTTAIFYCGPSPTPPGKVSGSIGPTTSIRLDPYTIALLKNGLKVMLGKGQRSPEIESAIREHGALYLVCVGGCSALLSKSVVSCETFLWPELGAEAVYRLEVKDLPCYVAIV